MDRSEIFISSKFNKEAHSVAGVARAYGDSLRRLRVDYLDAFLVHWPVPWLDQSTEAWRGLVALLERGRIPAIGVSNFKPAHLQKVIDATGIFPDLNQIQLGPDLARFRSRATHDRLGVWTVCWSPVGRGTELREHPTVIEIARSVQRTPTQVILRWHVQSGLIPVPRSSNVGRIAENVAIFDFELEVISKAALDALDRGEDAARDSDLRENNIDHVLIYRTWFCLTEKLSFVRGLVTS